MMLRKWYSGDILDFSVRVVVSDVRHFKRCDRFPQVTARTNSNSGFPFLSCEM